MTEDLPEPQNISETVLEDTATHPAYMNLMFWAEVFVAVLGLAALLAVTVLAWWSKPIPDGLGNVTQWAVIILGVLLVGDALLGKLAVKA